MVGEKIIVVWCVGVSRRVASVAAHFKVGNNQVIVGRRRFHVIVGGRRF